MLRKFKFSNYKIFKDEVVIDLNATKSEILKEYNVKNNILKGGLFYGCNGIGKSTVINVIRLLLDMVLKGVIFKENDICLFASEKIATFEYEFKFDYDEIIYSFSVGKTGKIVKEKLFLNNEEIFTRIACYATTVLFDMNEEVTVESNTLYLRNLFINNQISKFKPLVKWLNYLENSVYINSCSILNEDLNINTFEQSNLAKYLDVNGTEEINNFFKENNISYELFYDEVSILNKRFISASMKNLITNVEVELYLESYGNKILIQLLPYILKVKKDGGMLVLDEFGLGLHNKLNEFLISYLFKKTDNVQTFIVTHQTNLLKTSIIRPDQIFVIDCNNNGAYIQKASSKSPREAQNLEKMYLAGIFGGI